MRRAWLPSLIVGLPTAVACIYFGIVATPRYVSEAKFVVRSQETSSPNALGLALQGVGLSSSTTDAFIVHEYIKSRDAFIELSKNVDVGKVYVAKSADPFSRAIKPWQSGAQDELFNGVQSYLSVGYDARNGISVLRVQAFRPEDAVAVTKQLLKQSEELVNQMNARASARALFEASQHVERAERTLIEHQKAITEFRNSNNFVDPKFVSQLSGEVLGALKVRESQLNAEISALRTDTPNSPLLPKMLATLAGVKSEIEAEEAKISGSAKSYAPLVGRYEALVANLERAERGYTESVAALEIARRNQGKQQLFIENITQPSYEDVAAQPKRLRSILTVLLTSLLIYSVIWLVWTGVREHKQG
ncbi:hypothetical protein OB03_06805 [Brevundimonas sp. GN22]